MSLARDYALNGITCANCARKIENGIKNLQGIHEANLNFTLSKLSIRIEQNTSVAALEEQIQKLMDDIEPGSKLIVPPTHEADEENGGNCRDSARKRSKREKGLSRLRLMIYILGAAGYFAGLLLFKDPMIRDLLFILTYVVFGHAVLAKSFRNILKGRVFDENFLMAIASMGAFVIGEFPEGAAVMMFYQIGELLQDYAVDHSRRSIKGLLAIKPDFANLKTSEGIKQVDPSEVEIGDSIIIRPGERVPLDGVIAEGSSSLDASALTGESLPREASAGQEVLSGSINQSGVLVVKVTKAFRDSTVNRILALVENASQKKAVTERFITRFAAWYTPVVVALALMLALIPPLLFGESLNDWVYRALIFLVLSCPCALVISIPLGFFGGIGAASRKGILVKGGNYLEALAKVETVVFDKTGTLTHGAFEVTEIHSVSRAKEKEMLSYVAHAESFSTHPLAVSVVKACKESISRDQVSEYKEYAGMGVSAKVSGAEILCGNAKLLEQHGIAIPFGGTAGTVIHAAVNGKYAGWIKLEDSLKPDAPKAVEALHELGVEDIVMLTGDHKEAAKSVAGRLGIEMVHAELLPHEKVSCLEKIIEQRRKTGKVAFVGDGINDAPVIARADVGIAMGGAGSDAAIEAADIVMMTDEPVKVAEAIRIARKTKTVVFQNIFLAVAVKLLVLTLGAGGMATLWEAVFADVGVALLNVLNAMRLIRKK